MEDKKSAFLWIYNEITGWLQVDYQHLYLQVLIHRTRELDDIFQCNIIFKELLHNLYVVIVMLRIFTFHLILTILLQGRYLHSHFTAEEPGIREK